MLRKMFFRFSVLTLLIATVSSCSKKAGEYTHIIPSDAMVVSMDLKSLTDKAGIQGNDAEQMKQTLLDAVTRGTDASTRSQIEKVIRDPSESGIALDEPFYIFSSPTIQGNVAIAIKTSNIKNLRNTLKAFSTVNSQNGYEYVTLGQRGPLLAFNETTVLILSNNSAPTDELRRSAEKLMKQTAENSIREQKGFRKMTDQKGEITFWAPLSAFPNAELLKSSMAVPTEIDLKQVAVIGGFSFEKGKAVAEIDYYTENKEAKKLLDRRSDAIGSISNTYLKNLPASTLGFMSFSIHGEELYKMLQENPEFRRAIPGDATEQLESVCKAFKGDITLALTSVSLDRRFNPNPSFVMLAEVKDKASIRELHRLIEEEGATMQIRKRGEGEYVMSVDMEIFLGERDKIFYVTNELSLLANLDKGLDKSLKDASYASHAKGKSMYGVVNIASILDMPLVKLAAGMGGEEAQTYYQLGSLFEYVEFYVEKDSKTTFVLQMSNKETNALKQVVDFARGFAGL